MAKHLRKDLELAATALFLAEADPRVAAIGDPIRFRNLGLEIAREAGFSKETLEKIMLQAPGVLPSYLQLLSEQPDVGVVDLTRFGRNLGFDDAEDTARSILEDLSGEKEETDVSNSPPDLLTRGELGM